jgi:DNA-binding PadR family transcriptional regulator
LFLPGALLSRGGQLPQTGSDRLSRAISRLTEDEGVFLALLVRVEPATAYQLSKIYAESPVSNFGTSKGKVYPLIQRLQQRGLLNKKPVAGDSRRSELLSVTAAGRKVVRDWVMELKPDHFLVDDPLRTRLQSFDLLTEDQQFEWITSAREGLQRKLEELEAYGATVTVPFKEQVHDNAVTSVRTRLDWLDRLQSSTVRQRRARRS